MAVRQTSTRRESAMNYIYPQRPPLVVVYETEYQWVGDEGDMSAEGDHEGAYRKVIACVPDQWDREEGKTCVGLAVDVMNDQPAYLEADCSHGAPSWFSGCDHENERAWRTGGWTEYSVHLYGFSALQRTLIGKAYDR